MKYMKYLNYRHSWDDDNGYNCLTLIEAIYKEHHNIDFSDIWKVLGTKTGFTRNWNRKVTLTIFKELVKNWKEVDLSDMKEYDILAFTTPKKCLTHFGMQVHKPYRFIHLPECSKCIISELDDNWVSQLLGVYRHRDLV